VKIGTDNSLKGVKNFQRFIS